MGTLLYGVLWVWRLTQGADAFAYDSIVFAILLSLDSQLLFRWWVWRSSGR